MKLKQINFNNFFAMGCLLISLNSHAYTAVENETFDNEPPLIKNLLESASVLIASSNSVETDWKAANLYCEAARMGSAEGIYRLGMLYAFGQGVPENPEYAANLFSIASLHGHYQAQKMLETFNVSASNSPECILQAVAPEMKNTQFAKNDSNQHKVDEKNSIENLLAQLPKNKRWIIDMVEKIAKFHQVDPKLVMSIISVESNFSNMATSNKQAQGLMQLIPMTAERFNVKNAFDASQNIKGGVAYLRWLLAYFKGDVALAVAAYNAGEGAVNKYKGIPPYNETMAYVKKVQSRYPFKTHPYDAKIANPSPVFKSSLNKRNI